MYAQVIILSGLAALSEARFGQEQVPIQAIAGVTSGGAPGQAATLAGQTVSLLLAGANACAKLQQADAIIAALGTGADALAAAKGLVAAEKNFNPFAVSIPSICSDPSLPATEALRGIVPLVDPAVGGSDVENANSAQSLTTPFANAGMSVADIMAANGFTNFTTQALDGTAGQAPAGGNGGGAAAPAPVASSAAPAASAPPAAAEPPAGCPTTLVTVTRGAAAEPTVTAAPPANNGGNAGNNNDGNGGNAGNNGGNAGNNGGNGGNAGGNNGGNGGNAGGASPFGTCDPTIRFEGGLGGRPQTEFTFQSNDPQIEAVQQEALNPNIITNRICDSLVNFCGGSADGIATCQAAKATILASGKRDASVVDAWRTALGL